MIENTPHSLSDALNFLNPALQAEFQQYATPIHIRAKKEITREGQRNKFIPFLINGSVKVYTLNDGRELIYYYIRQNESCIMTLPSVFSDYVSKVRWYHCENPIKQ